jgi:hypothetical protein
MLDLLYGATPDTIAHYRNYGDLELYRRIAAKVMCACGNYVRDKILLLKISSQTNP